MTFAATPPSGNEVGMNANCSDYAQCLGWNGEGRFDGSPSDSRNMQRLRTIRRAVHLLWIVVSDGPAFSARVQCVYVDASVFHSLSM